jgi:FkbM family methyltransferase
MDHIDAFIRQHIRSCDVAFDIGANQGLYTRAMLEAGATVYAFEPNPEMAPILAAISPDPHLNIVERAVSDHAGTVDFYIDLRPGLGAAASSVHQLAGLETATKHITVDCTTIDDFCRIHALRPQFMKIDVEGNERAVFVGAAETIRRNRPLMIFEFWEAWWRRGISDIFAQLSADYELVVLGTNEDAYALYTADGDGRTGTVDIGCIPKQRV